MRKWNALENTIALGNLFGESVSLRLAGSPFFISEENCNGRK